MLRWPGQNGIISQIKSGTSPKDATNASFCWNLKNIIIAYERLRELAGVEDYESFASAHRMWVQAALEEIDAKRESRWTESIAVGGRAFIEHIKKAMGAMAKGRCLQPGEGAFELREVQSVYNAIFNHKNRDIDPK